MKRYFLFLFILLNVSLSFAQDNLAYAQAKINGKIFIFEAARNEEQWLKGLKFRQELDADSGMLFVYDKSKVLRFYMKDTAIPLDIAFIDEDFTIVDIQELMPFSETPVISKEKAKYALEVNRGFFKKQGIEINSRIDLEFPN